MKYMGSKSRIADQIVPIIQNLINESGYTTYIEPFVGGGNIIDKINCENKYGSDNNKYLISLLQNLNRLEELPSMVSKELYDQVRESVKNDSDQFEDWFKGAVGFLASYNDRFFDGGFSGSRFLLGLEKRNYYDESRRNLMAQRDNLLDVVFSYGDYEDLWNDIQNAVIYCDIPYKGKKQYDTSKNFSYNRFWDWVRKMSERNIVIVSEENAPDDFECIWSQDVLRSIKVEKKSRSIEKLFMYKGSLY